MHNPTVYTQIFPHNLSIPIYTSQSQPKLAPVTKRYVQSSLAKTKNRSLSPTVLGQSIDVLR